MNKQRILSLLADVIGCPIEDLSDLNPNENLSDFGLTSIGFIQFIVKIEDAFQIEVLDSDLILSNFATMQSLWNTLSKYFTVADSIKKVLVCDCDNVLWNGVAGEEDIVIDQCSQDLQSLLCTLVAEGVILCLCSKNDPTAIHAAFAHPDMLLKREHVTIEKINRADKASNILSLAKELNVSTDSLVFLDDSDYELGLINSLLPDVQTIKFHKNANALDAIRGIFSLTPVSDFNRTQQYREQKYREQDKQTYTSVEAYNASLNTNIACLNADVCDAPRISELSQRTNQCNFSGMRYTADEITERIIGDSYSVITLQVNDKYGDMGIVGCAIVHTVPTPVIENFFVSCRAFDRGFEEALLDAVKALYPNRTLQGYYFETDKNKRYRTFYQSNGVIVL